MIVPCYVIQCQSYFLAPHCLVRLSQLFPCWTQYLVPTASKRKSLAWSSGSKLNIVAEGCGEQSCCIWETEQGTGPGTMWRTQDHISMTHLEILQVHCTHCSHRSQSQGPGHPTTTTSHPSSATYSNTAPRTILNLKYIQSRVGSSPNLILLFLTQRETKIPTSEAPQF